jgi:hypothetical protein
MHLADEDILPSVSRRDPLRHHIVVWTASNRVFGCRSPQLLAVLAAALASSRPVAEAACTWLGRPPAADEQAHICQAVGQLTDLVRAEHAPSADTDTISASLTVRSAHDARSES